MPAAYSHCNRKEFLLLCGWLGSTLSIGLVQKGQLPASQKEQQSMVIMLDNLKQCISLIYHAAFDESAH